MLLSRLGTILLLTATVFLSAACEKTQTTQLGPRGLGLVQNAKPHDIAMLAEKNQVPVPLPAANPDGPRAGEFYENVQLLGDYSKSEFGRTMISIKNWVAPGQGCGYCHNAPYYEEDTKYPKLVAREMIKMVRHINSDWKEHVGKTGVTCWTCHRGNNVPQKIWFKPNDNDPHGMVAGRSPMRLPTASSGNTGLPSDVLEHYLLGNDNLRVVGTEALADKTNRRSIKQAKYTYGMMMVMSESLGVNCDFCHNTRAFYSWEQSRPQRATAWYGIRMVRDLNNTTLATVATLLPANRMGPAGDGPKIYCATCHQGVNKPLYGFPMVQDYPELIASKTPDYVPGPHPHSDKDDDDEDDEKPAPKKGGSGGLKSKR